MSDVNIFYIRHNVPLLLFLFLYTATVSKLAKRVNDCEQLDDPKAGDKRLRSSAGGVFDLIKHCLFSVHSAHCHLSMI